MQVLHVQPNGTFHISLDEMGLYRPNGIRESGNELQLPYDHFSMMVGIYSPI